MKDWTYCPYKNHRGLLIECDYCDALCKKQQCPYFSTLNQAKMDYQGRFQEAGKIMESCIDEMKRKIKEANKVLLAH